MTTTCTTSHACIVCAANILVGETELEEMMPGRIVLFLHRRCFELWTEVAAEVGPS
jgi:hypothetical protein